MSLVNVTARGGVCPPNARPGASAAAMNPVTMIKATPFAVGYDELFIVMNASRTRAGSCQSLIVPQFRSGEPPKVAVTARTFELGSMVEPFTTRTLLSGDQ